MPKRSRKKRLPDPNVSAFSIVQAIGGEQSAEPPSPPAEGKDPPAVALGRKGSGAINTELSHYKNGESGARHDFSERQ
jgi:hypothetical protein